MEPTIVHDEGRHQFTAVSDGLVARLQYQPVGDALDYYSTFVPTPLRHSGVATALVRHALTYARATGKKVIPSCWFVRKVMNNDPAYADLLADESVG